MGERIAVKPGSVFERTKSQKRQLALQTENSTVGINLFQALDSSDISRLGGTEASSDNVSEEELSSSAFATLSSDTQPSETSVTQGAMPQSSTPQSSALHSAATQSSGPQIVTAQSSGLQSTGVSSLHQTGTQQQMPEAQPDPALQPGTRATCCSRCQQYKKHKRFAACSCVQPQSSTFHRVMA